MKFTASPILIASLAITSSTLAAPTNGGAGSNLEVPRSPNLQGEGERSPSIRSPMIGEDWGLRPDGLPAKSTWGKRQLPSTNNLPPNPALEASQQLQQMLQQQQQQQQQQGVSGVPQSTADKIGSLIGMAKPIDTATRPNIADIKNLTPVNQINTVTSQVAANIPPNNALPSPVAVSDRLAAVPNAVQGQVQPAVAGTTGGIDITKLLAGRVANRRRSHPRDFRRRDDDDDNNDNDPSAQPAPTDAAPTTDGDVQAEGLISDLLPGPLGTTLGGIIDPLLDGLGKGLSSGTVPGILDGTVGGVTGSLNGLLGTLKPADADTAAAAADPTANPSADAVAAPADPVTRALRARQLEILNGALGTVGGVANTATGLVGGLLPGQLGSTVSGLGNTVTGTVGNTLGGLTSGLASGQPITGIVGTANGLVNGVAGSLPLGLGNTVGGLTDGLIGQNGVVTGLAGTVDGLTGGLLGGVTGSNGLLGGLLGGGAGQQQQQQQQQGGGGLLGGLLGGGNGGGLLGGLLGGSGAPAPAGAAAANIASTASSAVQGATSTVGGALPGPVGGLVNTLSSIPGGLVANLGNGQFLTGNGQIVNLSNLLGGVTSMATGATSGTPLSGATDTVKSLANGVTGQVGSTAQGILSNAPSSIANVANVAGSAASAAASSLPLPSGVPTPDPSTITSGKPAMSDAAHALAKQIAQSAGLDPSTVLSVINNSADPITAIQGLLLNVPPTTSLLGFPEENVQDLMGGATGVQPSSLGPMEQVLVGQAGSVLTNNKVPIPSSAPSSASSAFGTATSALAGAVSGIPTSALPVPVPSAPVDTANAFGGIPDLGNMVLHDEEFPNFPSQLNDQYAQLPDMGIQSTENGIASSLPISAPSQIASATGALPIPAAASSLPSGAPISAVPSNPVSMSTSASNLPSSLPSGMPVPLFDIASMSASGWAPSSIAGAIPSSAPMDPNSSAGLF